MAEPSYIIEPSSEAEEPVQQNTPNRKALRKAAKVLRGSLPRRELFARYGVPSSTEYRILAAESSKRRRMNSERKRKLSVKQMTEILDWIHDRFDRRAMTWDRLIAEFDLAVNFQTLKRRCHEREYRRCRACWKRYLKPEISTKRRTFAREHESWDSN